MRTFLIIALYAFDSINLFFNPPRKSPVFLNTAEFVIASETVAAVFPTHDLIVVYVSDVVTRFNTLLAVALVASQVLPAVLEKMLVLVFALCGVVKSV